MARPTLLRDLVRPVHPLWDYLHDAANTPYYWMAEQCEWATDLLFHARAQLAALQHDDPASRPDRLQRDPHAVVVARHLERDIHPESGHWFVRL